MKTEAQKRAQKKYNKEKMKQVCIQFFPAEYDLYEKVQENGKRFGGMNAYIKNLIRES